MDKYEIAWGMLKAYLDGKTEESKNNFGKEILTRIERIEKQLGITENQGEG